MIKKIKAAIKKRVVTDLCVAIDRPRKLANLDFSDSFGIIWHENDYFLQKKGFQKILLYLSYNII